MKRAPQQIRILIDRRPTNLQVREKGTASYFAEVVMCEEEATGLLLGQAMVKPNEGDQAMIAAAQETLDLVRQRAPGARVTWVLRQERLAGPLAICFPEVESEIVPVEAFAPWNEAYLGLDQHLGSGGRLLPYLVRGGISPQEVAELFGAAADFYRARPWDFITDARLLKIPSPWREEPPLLASVMGASGITYGLTLFDSEADYERMQSGKRQVNALSVSFEPQSALPPTLTGEAREHEWPLASKSAFPLVMRVRKGKQVPSSGPDLRRATAALRVLTEVTTAFRERHRGEGEPQA